MTYTPINWQTGDTITAEKMNKMDNGWGVESTQLFSESVTTVDQGGTYNAMLAYSGTIDADTIAVIFDGTEYTCPRIDDGGIFYGGYSQGEPDFTDYPFFITVGFMNVLTTDTAGEHTIAVSAPAIQASSDFIKALASNRFVVTASWDDELSGYTLDKTAAEIYEAAHAGYICYMQGDITGEVSAAYFLDNYMLETSNQISIATDFTPPLLVLHRYTWDPSNSVFLEEVFNYTLTPAS